MLLPLVAAQVKRFLAFQGIIQTDPLLRLARAIARGIEVKIRKCFGEKIQNVSSSVGRF